MHGNLGCAERRSSRLIELRCCNLCDHIVLNSQWKQLEEEQLEEEQLETWNGA